MRTRMLGDTGIVVGEIGLGCGGLGLPGKDDLEDVLEYAFDHGVTFYDTADMYGGGRSEETLGRVFAGRRDEIVLATKFGTVIRGESRRRTGPGSILLPRPRFQKGRRGIARRRWQRRPRGRRCQRRQATGDHPRALGAPPARQARSQSFTAKHQPA